MCVCVCVCEREREREGEREKERERKCSPEPHCPEGLLLKGVVMQELIWESYEAIRWPPCSSSKGVYCGTSNAPREEAQGRAETT